jgi:hypothetical protein
MPKGAKKGENRFKSKQDKLLTFRAERLKNNVLPTIKSYVGKISVNGKSAYCKLCAAIFNQDLPVNEKPIGYRTIEQNIKYWELVGPIYHRHWEPDGDAENTKRNIQSQIHARQNAQLKEQVEDLKEKVLALEAALKNHGADLKIESPESVDGESHIKEFELTCIALKTVIDASDEEFLVDDKNSKITCSSDDLEPQEGLVPKAIAKPFIDWLQERRVKTGVRS